MDIQINPIYHQFINHEIPATYLQSNADELCEGPKEIDFSITEKTWLDTVKTVVQVILKIVIIPWGLFESLRWCFQRLAMIQIYPAQSSLMKKWYPQFQTQFLDRARVELGKQPGFIVRHVTLQKDGVCSSGLLIGTPETIENGKWVLQATGNGEPIEGAFHVPEEESELELQLSYAAERVMIRAHKYQEVGYNLLLVNNPGVGRSEGTATPETIGECQETAVRFLETALKAHRIVLAGYSIGGGAIGQGILRHDFNTKEVNFFVARQVSFGRVSELAEALAPESLKWCAKGLVCLTGCEMDNVESSRKLAQLGISEIVIQGEADRVIPYEHSLMNALQKEKIGFNHETNHILLPGVDHGDFIPVLDKTVEKILAWEIGLELEQLAE